jgi:hypothetical protein
MTILIYWLPLSFLNRASSISLIHGFAHEPQILDTLSTDTLRDSDLKAGQSLSTVDSLLMAPPTAEYPEPVPPRKRRRTALACEECRDRKRKCDGVKPICGACKGRSTAQCIWKQERNSKGWWSNRYIQMLITPNLTDPSHKVLPVLQLCPGAQESYQGIGGYAEHGEYPRRRC